MNKSNINVPSAQTTVDSDSTAENQHVSQPNANTNVVGSLFKSREIKFRAWLIPDDDFESDLPYMTYDLAFEDYAPVNEQLKSVSTLMQYTGLKDKNGKEIYEGDILKSNYSLPLVVVFSDGKFCFYNSQSSGSDVLSQMRVEKLDVIGNIFENPKLLQTLR